jgi:DNA helicase-2/ATP-dependent DNA helicase PcrA
VSLVKEDYILSGRVNIIKGKNNTIELIDFRGEQKPDISQPAVQEKLKHYQRQLEIYAHLVENRTGEKVSKMHLYYTGAVNEHPQISFEPDNNAIATTISAFDKIVGRIEKKDFDMRGIKKSEQLCGNCDMRFYCNMRCGK